MDPSSPKPDVPGLGNRECLPDHKFCDLVPKNCPDLTGLQLIGILSDQDIAKILDSMPRIKNLQLEQSQFGNESILALRRHFVTLTDINHLDASVSTSQSVQIILSSCPNLVSLQADEILYSDMVNKQQPRVCQRHLQTLIFGIRSENTNWKDHKGVYDRLAEMIELRILAIGASWKGWDEILDRLRCHGVRLMFFVGRDGSVDDLKEYTVLDHICYSTEEYAYEDEDEYEYEYEYEEETDDETDETEWSTIDDNGESDDEDEAESNLSEEEFHSAEDTPTLKAHQNCSKILACIERYLTKEDAINCIRVCKTWKAEFEPTIWRTFKLFNIPKSLMHPRAAIEVVQRNAKYVHHLEVEFICGSPVAHPRLSCPQLQTLKFVTLEGYDDVDDDAKDSKGNAAELTTLLWTNLSETLKDHRTLQKVQIYSDTGLTPPAHFWKTLTTCQKLTEIDTYGLILEPDLMLPYLEACSSPTICTVKTDGDSFDDLFTWPKDISFPELLTLEIGLSADGNSAPALSWILLCPKLTSLDWTSSDEVWSEMFANLVPKACPNLTCLRLQMFIEDEELALIINEIPRIEELHLEQSDFYEHSMAALRRHFPYLRDLNLLEAENRTSRFVQEIMSSCPNLLVLRANDFVFTEETINQHPWVCLKLRTLHLGINVGDLTWERHHEIYRRFAQLTELRNLVTGWTTGMIHDEDKESIELSKRAGIDALKTLTRLESFYPRGILEEAIEKDGFEVVTWMLDHWKNLKTLVGHLPRNVKGYDAIMKRLKERSIRIENFEIDPDSMYGDGSFVDYHGYGELDHNDEFIPHRSLYSHDYYLDDEHDYSEYGYDDEEEEEEGEWETTDEDGETSKEEEPEEDGRK
ncbi:hypothetical protein BGZ83_008608 [Gryganskiella cystojenkinii]|nr:hypothetical protein BGZ83_008608 [Gryganskiella cystojenkinii]